MDVKRMNVSNTNQLPQSEVYDVYGNVDDKFEDENNDVEEPIRFMRLLVPLLQSMLYFMMLLCTIYYNIVCNLIMMLCMKRYF